MVLVGSSIVYGDYIYVLCHLKSSDFYIFSNPTMSIEDELSPWTVAMHLTTILLVYAYIKE